MHIENEYVLGDDIRSDEADVFEPDTVVLRSGIRLAEVERLTGSVHAGLVAVDIGLADLSQVTADNVPSLRRYYGARRSATAAWFSSPP